MSLVTALPMKVAPSAAAAASVTFGASQWAYGSWVELITSTSNPIVILGVAVVPSALFCVEVQLGTGGAGSETAIGSVLVNVLNSASSNPRVVMLPVAIDNVPTSTRVAVRIRGTVTSLQNCGIAILYTENFDSTQSSANAYSYVPAGSGGAFGASITPNGSAWANSSYVEMTSGIANEITLLGLASSINTSGVDYEWDLATGGSGSESVISTLRGDSGGQGVNNLWLPAPYPIVASTRVAVRLRKSDTNTTAKNVAILYLDGTHLISTIADRRTFHGIGTRIGSRAARH